jgi:hypothetical protein
MSAKFHIISRLAILVLAIAFSLLIIRRDGVRNASPCALTPGCVTENTRLSGTITTTSYGFPVAYRTSQAFRPTQGADYKEISITQKAVNIPVILIDVLFWFALLELLWRTRLDIRSWYERRFIHSSSAEAHTGKSDTTA